MIQLKHALASFIFITTVFIQLNAQSIVLCESYDDQGKASGIYSTWEIKQTGGNVYMVYNQSSTLSSGSWYLYLDYDWDNVGTYQAYETFTITPERGKNWFAYDYKFTDVGKYKASVMYNGTEVASSYFVINYVAGDTPVTSDDEVDTYYYENSSILFCNSIDAEGNPVGEATSFSMRRTGTVDVSVYLDNHGLPFRTNKMYVDVYNEETNLKFDTFSVDVEPDWDYVKFVQTFTTPGKYYFDYYNEDDIFINTSGTVTITE